LNREEIEKPAFFVNKAPTSTIGRRKDIAKIVDRLSLYNLNDVLKERVVAVYGFPGVGKSEIVQQVALHFQERRHFADGVLFLNQKNLEQPLALNILD